MKINTNALRERITTELSAIVTKVVYQRTVLPIKPPYVVYDIKPLQTIDGKTQCSFEVNLFDTDAETIEDNADAVEELFDHFNFTNNKVSFYTYRNGRQNMTDEDKTVKRIRLTFELYLYSKEA